MGFVTKYNLRVVPSIVKGPGNNRLADRESGRLAVTGWLINLLLGWKILFSSPNVVNGLRVIVNNFAPSMLKAAANTYREAYTGLSRSTWLLSLIMLINRSGTMVVPFMTLYLTSPEMGYSIGQAGVVFGLFGAGAFCGAWVGGKLTDRIGFYPVQMMALVGGGILFMALGQMRSYSLICLFTFGVSFVNEAFRPANSTAIAHYSHASNRVRSYSLNRLAINLGWALGAAMGGVLAHWDYEILFWVDGCTNIAAALLMWACIKPNRHIRPVVNAEEKPLLPAYRDKPYMLFLVLTTLFACCFFQIFTNLPVFLRTDFRLSEPFIGFLMALNGIIIAVIEMVLVYKLEQHNRNMRYITLGVGLVGLSFLTLYLPLGVVFVSLAMIIIVTFGEILSMPFMNSYWLSRSVPSNRGQYAGLYTMGWSVAQTLGPVGGSQIAQYAGFEILWWIIGGLSLLVAFSFHKLFRNSGG